MCEQIKRTLLNKFENSRIVFWYDKDQQFKEDFANLKLDGVKKLTIGENEFALKYQIMKEEPNQKFLLYKPAEKPEDAQNWLLDVLLANDEFHAEQWALILAELGLGSEYSDITKEHAFFFNSKERKEKLKTLLGKSETLKQVRMKMLFVISKAEGDINSVVENLLHEYAIGKNEMMNAITKSKLDGFLYDRMQEAYGYSSATPNVKDFIFNTFERSFANDMDSVENSGTGAKIFLNQWKNDVRYAADFEKISNEAAEILKIEDAVYQKDYKTLVAADYFEAIDKRIIAALIENLRKRTITPKEVFDIITQRRTMKWYKRYENLYQAIWYAAAFIELVEKEEQFVVNSVATGVENYTNNWYKIDQYYRKFIYNLKVSGQVSGFEQLMENIENLYSNKYLLNMNDSWQQQIDKKTVWEFDCIDRQRDFYQKYVASSKTKLCVIISDALRYEIGDELAARIRQLDRFDAKLNKAITGLPSYTQLGMASLLPHNALEIIERDLTVTADDAPTSGLENRNKILQQKASDALALKDTDILNNNSEGLREIAKNNSIIYVFHNKIDEVGHSLSSEGQAFQAAEDTIEELIKIMRKLVNADIYNIIITSDHGFIYQNKELDEDEYLGVEPVGDVIKKDRRFVKLKR